MNSKAGFYYFVKTQIELIFLIIRIYYESGEIFSNR